MRLPKLKNQYNQIRTGYLVIIDIGCIAVALNVFALFHHVLPRKLSAQGDKESYIAEQQSAGTSMENFTDKFTDGEVIQDDTTYKSGDISIAVNEVSKDNMRYYVADIYVKDITKIKTAFAKGTYGKAITDTVLNMAEENGAVLAANGDYYGTGETGVVIRNGVLYRGDADEDVCVLFKDGTMKIYHKDSFDSDTVMAQGAWQAWSFGPSLLSDSGEAVSNFTSRISRNNPRTALGYYEPGHYCLVLVDGRQADTNGATLAELSSIMKNLGCTVAYNLDGGQSSTMTFGDGIVNSPVNGGRKVSDIIYIGE